MHLFPHHSNTLLCVLYMQHRSKLCPIANILRILDATELVQDFSFHDLSLNTHLSMYKHTSGSMQVRESVLRRLSQSLLLVVPFMFHVKGKFVNRLWTLAFGLKAHLLSCTLAKL